MPTAGVEDDLIGRSLQSYRIEGHLGAGSMANVYRARDVLTRAEVALKIHTRKENEPSRRRFLQEARAANLLEHPGIVEVLELGVEGDTTFIAMELVRGAPLSAVLAGGPLPWPEVARLLAQIASALGHAHAAGVMHRDLKPSNVLLTHEGRVKLVDFGLAKRVGAIADASDGATVWDWSDVHTQPGAVLGTPAYMAPEQARAGHVDARADVFSLGVLGWEALTGQPLFRRATPAATLRAILLEDAPDPRVLAPDCPVWLAALLRRALSKDAAQRFDDARDLLQELRLGLGSEAGERGAPPGEALDVALSRIAERRSLTLAEPPFVGRAREVELAASSLAEPGGSALLVGIPGAGRKRIARRALAKVGATRPLLVRFTEGDALTRAFLERPYDSVVIDADALPGDQVLEAARTALGPRVRVAVIAQHATSGAPRVPVRGLSPSEGVDILSRGLMGEVSDGTATDPKGALFEIARGVGGHAQSLVAIAGALARQDAPSIAAALELDEGWPEALAALTGLRGWIEAQLRGLSAAERMVLAALSVAPSLAEQDAQALAALTEGGVDALLRLRATPLIEGVVHPERLGAPRLAIPALVRRASPRSDEGDRVRSEARHLLLHRLARRCHLSSRDALDRPDSDAVAELRAERDVVLTLASRALLDAGPASAQSSQGRHTPILEDAVTALVAMSEADALRDPSGVGGDGSAAPGVIDGATVGDHLLGRALARSLLPPPLVLRAVVARCVPTPGSARPPHDAGLDDALALAAQRGDVAATCRLRLARADRALRLAADVTSVRADLEESLSALAPDAPAWIRQSVLEHAGELWWTIGAADPARGALRNALVVAEERNDARGRARLIHRLARLEIASRPMLEDATLHAAQVEETRALELALTTGDALLTSRIETALAELAILASDPTRARAHVDRAAALGPASLGRAALVAGHIELLAGRFERARALYGAALHHATASADEPAVAVAHAGSAAALSAAGDRNGASDALVRATLAARTLPSGVRLVVGGWRGHLERAFLDRDRAALGHGEPERVEIAAARFTEAGLVAGAASEAGTGAHIGAYLLAHAAAP